MKAFPIKNRYYRLKLKVHQFLARKIKIGICHGVCGPCFRRGRLRRQNTRYVDESRNWVFLCDKCAYINNEYWLERWQEYYSEVM